MTPVRFCPRCREHFDPSVKFCPRDGTALRMDTRGDALLGETLLERYRIVRVLGEGGMARVYLAEHSLLGRTCAVKIIREGLGDNPDARARFYREAANASRIMHPNVAAVFDFGDAGDGMLFYAMEFVEGEPLSELLAGGASLAPRRAASIAWQVADALTAAHDLGIVHRDLKPENVMVGRHRDGSDLAKVVDFGVARIMGSDAQKVTSTGMVVGTPDYMSPEQLAGDPTDARSDLYSLGILLFRSLAGELPFRRRGAHEALAARMRGPALTLAEVRPDVRWPVGLEAVLARSLREDPDERHASAPEFATDLVQAVLDWLPDDEAGRETWDRRLRYSTPVRSHSAAPTRGTAEAGGT